MARYELREGRELRGVLDRLDTSPRALTPNQTWEIQVHRRHLQWFAIAIRPDHDSADAAFYPRVRSGGTIAFEDRRYRLHQRFFTLPWELHSAPDGRIATLTPHKRKKPYQEWAVTLSIRLEPHGRDAPEIWLALLLCIWVIAMDWRPIGYGG